MSYLKFFFDFYINASIHVAIAVVSLVYITYMEFDVILDYFLLLFIFLATITAYNFIKYYGLAKFQHRSLANWLKAIQIFSFVCFMALCYLAFFLPFKTVLILLVFGFIVLLYAIPVLPRHIFLDTKQNLRSISGLKIYVIALVWCGVTVFLPLVNAQFNINTDVIITGIQRFLFVIVLMLPFEIRDMQYDSIKLSTIPQHIGLKATKFIGFLLVMVFFFLEYFKDTIHVARIVILLGITFLTLLLVLFSKKNQNKYYSSFWVEGIPIYWVLLLVLFN